MKTCEINLCINGDDYHLNIPVNRTLLQVIREDLNLVETKYGCGLGECGACTVLLDGKKAILACISLAATMNGKEITTVAGLGDDGQLHAIQEAFVEEGAIQCGYCTPGMVMRTASLLAENPKPTEEEIRKGLEGNICRCTGYEKIVCAVKRASDTMSVRK